MRCCMVFLALALIFCASIVWNINTGSVNISLTDIIRIIFTKDNTDPASYNIIWKIRLPRLLTAAVLGGALSLAGFLLQTFFRNPIAGPFVLGISSGAKMFLAVVTIALTGIFPTIPVSLTVISAFLGSMMSMFLVLAFSGKIRNMSMLLVIGIMISYICSAVTDFLINLAGKISDKIVCVKGDRIAAYGSPDEIFSDERINELYEIKRGSYNALLGSVELAKPAGEASIFLIGGAGYGVKYYRALQKASVPFSAGILWENDVDYTVASVLAKEIVSVKPFTQITESEIAKAKQIIDRVSTVIDCGCPIGEFNRANAELLRYAASKVTTEVPV